MEREAAVFDLQAVVNEALLDVRTRFYDILLAREQIKVQEQNFDTYRLLRINESPVIEIHLLTSDEKPGGMGEPSVALVAPAVCNAIYSATRKRLRKLPITQQGFVV